ncbi:MAG: ABC transporter ATP-binding protein [Wenzhouxiangellaceae bacterium]
MTVVEPLILQARDVHQRFIGAEGPLTILDGIDLTVGTGEAIAIVGASGSGKSTLLGLLAGLDLPLRGSIRLAGHELTGLTDDQRARLRAQLTGFVFQAFHLMNDLSAEENVALPLELFGHSAPTAAAREWLRRLGLSKRGHHRPAQLSGGEQQRVALCRAFALQPAVLFADEPTANLDPTTGQQVIDQLFDLRREARTAMILVTHDESLARRCDRVLHLRRGRLS